ncbi:hypothetical protein ACSBR1_014421 [Camellia fascicularis]
MKDVYIPFKRRKQTRSRFGFIRYDCPIAAHIALHKANGLWCDNRALKVKSVDFGKDYGVKPRSPYVQEVRKDGEANYVYAIIEYRKKTYAQVVEEGVKRDNTSITVRAYEEGNGWLYESVIICLKPYCSVAEFKKELVKRGMGVIKVTTGGGRDVVVSFESVQEIKEKLIKMNEWIQELSESVKEWKRGNVYRARKMCLVELLRGAFKPLEQQNL